jgi:60S ribosome subunit biogenesis protein NIP7
MRPLTDDETKMVFAKLEKFIGTEGIAQLIDRKDSPHVFRLHQNRVYYLSEAQVREITNFSRDKLVSTGICVGKVTHSGKFRLTIHILEVLAQFAKHKVWLKPSAEMSYLYGHHVTKVGLSKVTEGIPQNAGVVVFSETQVPLGFGVAAQPTDALPNLEPTALVVLNCTARFSFDMDYLGLTTCRKQMQIMANG